MLLFERYSSNTSTAVLKVWQKYNQPRKQRVFVYKNNRL